MKIKWLTVVVVGIILLLVVSFTSCTSTHSQTLTPAPSPTQAPAPQETPTITPEPVSPKPPTTGDIQGRLISAETKKPLAGAAIILGLVTGEAECTIQSDLIALTGKDGAFQLSEVPPGIYVVFYNPSGDVNINTQEIKNLKINYGLVGKPPRGSDSYITYELYDTLSGNDTLLFHFEAGLTTSIKYDSLQKPSIEFIVGLFAFHSYKYGLTMQFKDGEPITLEVKVGETTNVEIMAMVTDVIPPLISEVTVSDIVSTGSVNITWKTDELATSQVEYGKTARYRKFTTIDKTLTANHQVTLTGLEWETTYYFRAISEDDEGNRVTSDNFTFTTTKKE